MAKEGGDMFLKYVAEFFMHIGDAPYYVQLVVVAVSAVLLLGGNAGGRRGVLLFLADSLVLAAALLLLNLLFFLLGVAAHVYVGSYLHFLLGIVLYALLRSRYSPPVRVAMACVAFSTVTLLSAFGTTVGNMFEQYIEGFDIAVTKYLSSFAIVLFAVVFSNYSLARFDVGWFNAVLNGTCNILSALLCVIFEFWRFYDRSFGRMAQGISGYISIVILFVLVIDVVTYFMTYFICREKERVLAYQTERQKSRSLEELLKLSETRLAELREVRHDVKNQYAFMQTMLEEGRYDDLRAYFDELVGTFSKPLYDVVESGNVMIASVLNLELSKVRAAGLKMDVRVAVPAELPFAQSGILALFTNIIDNAAEACQREGFAGAQIEVSVCIKGDYLLFCVTNPTKKLEAAEEGTTSKADKKVHGFGTKIIKKVVKKYNGYYRCFVKDGQYVSEALLDLNYARTAGPAGMERG